jgi:DNA polymerase-3 subunit delta'
MNLPPSFRDNWELIGHQWAINLFKKHLQTNRIRHAYLITGPSGIGRRTLGLRFAQVLNSPQHQYNPEDPDSRRIAQMQHPDLSIVQREEGDRDIKIDAIRSLQHTLSLSPYTAEHRVALLINFDEANDNAANALLKTLEEPAGRVVLLLTAESTESLLPTIVSRCEIIRLRPVPLSELAAGLTQQTGIPEEQALLLAHISAGKPGYALHLAQNPELLEQRTRWLEDQTNLLRGSRVKRFAYAEQISKDKSQLTQTMVVWLSYWRDVMLQTTSSSTPLTNPDRAEEITSLARHLDPNTAQQVVMTLEKMLGELRTNVNVRLAAEALMLQLPFIPN